MKSKTSKAKVAASRTKRSAGSQQRVVMPGVRIVKTLRVTNKCGHESDHPMNTPRKWLKQATERECSQCQYEHSEKRARA